MIKFKRYLLTYINDNKKLLSAYLIKRMKINCQLNKNELKK